MRSQCSGRILVLSRLKSCVQSTSQMPEISGTYRSSCLLVSSGSSPLSPISEAIVPPVPIRSIRFFSIVQIIPFLITAYFLSVLHEITAISFLPVFLYLPADKASSILHMPIYISDVYAKRPHSRNVPSGVYISSVSMSS